MINMAVCQNLVPLLNIKIAGKWMFIPLKMVLIGIDPYPYYGTCAIATVRENGHLPGREQLRVSRTSTLEGFVVVRVNASKSNVLMVQAVRTLHSKINFKNFQPGILPIQDPFLISYILCWKNPTWEQKKPFPDSKPKLEKQKAKTRRKPTIPAIPNLCFCAGILEHAQCTNHAGTIHLAPIYKSWSSPESPRRRISGVRCLVPEVHMLRPHESLGFATITSLWENSQKKNLDGNLPEIGGGKKRARFEARRHGQGIFAWATKVNPQGHAVFDKNVGQFLLILLLKNVKKPLNSVQIWLAMVESSINQPIATKMWVSTSALVWHKLQRRLVIRQWKITTFNCKYCKIDCPRSQQWSECIPLFC